MNLNEIGYTQLSAIFKQFKTENTEEQELITLVCQLSALEVDAEVWGNLGLQGVLYLAACRLSRIFSQEMQAELGKSALALLQNIQSPSTGTDKPTIIRTFTVEGEYSVTYGDASDLGQTAISEIFKSINNNSGENNFYCQEYERLKNSVGVGILYSGG